MTMTDISPLDDIARYLFAGCPPSLTWLEDLLHNAKYNEVFLGLVREYLPAHEREIMEQTTEDKIGLFIRYFGEEYFELDDSYEGAFEEGRELMSNFIGFCPAFPRGTDDEEYHEFQDKRHGLIMLMSLISSPYEPPEDFQGCHGYIPRSSGGERIPMIEWIKDNIGADAAKKIPARGWQPAELMKMTKGSKFSALADYADIIHHSTGNWWLDNEQQDWDPPSWDRREIDRLMEQNLQAEELFNRVYTLCDWLEEKPHARFLQMLNYLQNYKKSWKAAGTLTMVFGEENGKEDHCPEKLRQL